MLKKYMLLVGFIDFILFTSTKMERSYGEFSLQIIQYETCKGPKRRNCTKITVETPNITCINYDFLVTDDMASLKGKLIATLNNKEMYRIQIKNVCENFFFKHLMSSFLNNKGERCGVYKGHYKFHADVEKIATNFYGGRIAYGNWTYHSLFWNDFCNFHCEHIHVQIKPKTTTSNKTQVIPAPIKYLIETS